MIYHYLVAKYFREPFYILARSRHCSSRRSCQIVRHQIMCRFNPNYLEPVWMQLYKHFTAYILLGIAQKRFDVAHNRVVGIAPHATSYRRMMKAGLSTKAAIW